MATVEVTVTFPDNDLRAFVQHLRDFESASPDTRHLRMLVRDTGFQPHEIEEIFRSIKPPFPT